MMLTEENVQNSENHTLELTYQWEHMLRPDRVQVWIDTATGLYHVKFDGYTSSRFIHFGGVIVYLGQLAHNDDWV